MSTNTNNRSKNVLLLDPSLLIGLNEEERKEALTAAAIAHRAEERAEQRAIQRAMEQKEMERRRSSTATAAATSSSSTTTTTTSTNNNNNKQRQPFENVIKDTSNNHDNNKKRKQEALVQLLLSERNNTNNNLPIESSLSTTTSAINNSLNNNTNTNNSNSNRVVFVPKTKRYLQKKNNNNNDNNNNHNDSEQQQRTNGLRNNDDDNKNPKTSNVNNKNSNNAYRSTTGGIVSTNSKQLSAASTTTTTTKDSTTTTTATAMLLSAREMKTIQETYLGKTAASVLLDNNNFDDKKKQQQRRNNNNSNTNTTANKKITFKFRWDETDDTFVDDDPLYNKNMMMTMIPSAAIGAAAAVTNRSYHHHHQNQHRTNNTNDGHTKYNNNDNNNSNNTNQRTKKKKNVTSWIIGDEISTIDSVQNKPLNKMTSRDWRILRENYEIVVKGGKAPPPLRTFQEIHNLHPSLLDAIENVLQFKLPSPIQRQAIPIGLQRRDLIGIAETGSGKTIAFGIPLCQYLIQLPKVILNNVSDSGPLALIMAPTRELALQINIEITKLLSKCNHIVRTCAIVGGQSIQQQAQELRNPGVHIVVGTPGRINECIDMAYLVLNKCCYIVLDEADRMIDMGFAPQMESILDAMGGILKSENEHEAYKQEEEDLNNNTDVARHRVTAMFSATMPMEVEKIAKRYLRHPAIVSIGDQDSGKNARIVQKLIWLSSPAKKEEALRDLIRSNNHISGGGGDRGRYGDRGHPQQQEKILVFVNEKRHADYVGRIVERAGRQCVVLHGGKTQEQREENLELFRKGGVVMVATDVAGRGLDIPDVTHVINYDLPTRSIENYTHRIGRTGRAGKDGYATSFITDQDEGIMGPLRAYLESTGNTVPDRLARHPSAKQGSTSFNNIMY